jgi:hypothetical protein
MIEARRRDRTPRARKRGEYEGLILEASFRVVFAA